MGFWSLAAQYVVLRMSSLLWEQRDWKGLEGSSSQTRALLTHEVFGHIFIELGLSVLCD